MHANSSWLVAAKALQMGSGFFFWVIAARNADVVDVGVAAATVSAILVCTQLGILGTGSAVIMELGVGGDRQRVLDAAFSVMALAAAATAAAYLGLVGLGDREQVPPAQVGIFFALFLVASILGTALICLDQVSVAVQRADSGALRYGVGGLLSLAAVGAASTTGRLDALALVACWTLGSAAAVGIGFVQLAKRSGYVYRPRLPTDQVRRVMNVGVRNHLLTLTERLPPLVVPIILAHVVSPTQTAFWYPAWMMVWAAFYVPISVGLVQFSDGVRSPERLRRSVRSGMGMSLLVGGGICLVLALGARLFLSMLGADYADASVDALRILTLGLVPFMVLQSYNAVCRATDRTTEGTLLGAVVMAAVCAGTAVFGDEGTTAVAVVWVLSTAAGSLWALWRLRRILDASGVSDG